jgi:hypothetical protein
MASGCAKPIIEIGKRVTKREAPRVRDKLIRAYMRPRARVRGFSLSVFICPLGYRDLGRSTNAPVSDPLGAALMSPVPPRDRYQYRDSEEVRDSVS